MVGKNCLPKYKKVPNLTSDFIATDIKLIAGWFVIDCIFACIRRSGGVQGSPGASRDRRGHEIWAPSKASKWHSNVDPCLDLHWEMAPSLLRVCVCACAHMFVCVCLHWHHVGAGKVWVLIKGFLLKEQTIDHCGSIKIRSGYTRQYVWNVRLHTATL